MHMYNNKGVSQDLTVSSISSNLSIRSAIIQDFLPCCKNKAVLLALSAVASLSAVVQPHRPLRCHSAEPMAVPSSKMCFIRNSNLLVLDLRVRVLEYTHGD